MKMAAPASGTGRLLTERDAISCDADVVGGIPVFRGTRVLATTLFDYLLHNASLDGFYDEFPTVTPAHVAAVLRSARDRVSLSTFPPRDATQRAE
jgi:uncharacterized protein (DUF433 family)